MQPAHTLAAFLSLNDVDISLQSDSEAIFVYA